MHRLHLHHSIGKHIYWKCANMHCGYIDWGSGTERMTICPFVPTRDGANTPSLEGEYDSGYTQRHHFSKLENIARSKANR